MVEGAQANPGGRREEACKSRSIPRSKEARPGREWLSERTVAFGGGTVRACSPTQSKPGSSASSPVLLFPSHVSPPPATGWPSLGAGGHMTGAPLMQLGLPVHRSGKRGVGSEHGGANGRHLILWGELVKNMNDGEREVVVESSCLPEIQPPLPSLPKSHPPCCNYHPRPRLGVKPSLAPLIIPSDRGCH